MRLIAALVLASFLVPSSATGAPVKSKPEQTIDRIKKAFAKKDHGAEWDTLSPGFKKRLSRRAGRNVDVGDYVAARNAHRRDPRLQELQTWMHTAHATRIKYDDRGKAKVTIRFGAPLLLGKDVTVTMIHHELWQLWIKGEKQPYWGFKNSRSIRVFRHPKTNVHTVQTMDAKGKVTWQKKFPAKKVQAYRTLTRWYFHDFGNYEKAFMNAATPSDNRVPAARTRPRPRTRQPSR